MNKRVARYEAEGAPPLQTHYDSSWMEFDAADLDAIRATGLLKGERGDQFEEGDIIFARQLDYIKAKVYERRFPEIQANVLVPDASDVPEYVEEFTVKVYDLVGMAKVIANYADDLPRADTRASSVKVRVKTLGDSYGFSVMEVRASRATGEGLEQRKATAARRAIELKLANIKMVGDSIFGIIGLFTHPNLPEMVLPHSGSWATLSGPDIYENLIALWDAYDIQTQGVHRPNFLALAPTAYRNAMTKFMLDNNPTVTPLQQFKLLFPEIEIRSITEMAGIKPVNGQPNADLALLYERDVDNLSHQYIMPFTQLPPEARNLEFVVNCIARTAGVQLWYPLALLSAVTS
jgi:hypothetical protein